MGDPRDASRPRPPSPDEWRILEPMLDAVLDAAPEGRAALIMQLARGDRERLAALERLLAECEEAYPLLDQTAGEQFDVVFGDEVLSMPAILAERYELVGEVGRGGMAIVYLARDLKHGRDVAVKVVRPELAAGLGRPRFLEEIRIAARLRHPHIVPLYDSGEQPGVPAGEEGSGHDAILYYVMPYEPGRSLRERLDRDGALSTQAALNILRDVCDAMGHAHRNGIVHRDIKPENILLSGANAMIADFGVARALSEASTGPLAPAPGTLVGTRTYMAPEQADGAVDVDHRADIYAFGVLAWELLTGTPPGRAPTGLALAHRSAGDTADVALLEGSPLPSPLLGVISRCLARHPRDRWQSADELLIQLDAAAVFSTERVAPARPGHHSLRMAIAAGVASGGLALALAAIAASRNRSDPLQLVLGTATQLTSEPGLEVQPAISPNGKVVAYATGHSAQMRIALRPMAGGRPAYLTRDTTFNQWLPRWSPDGTRILFLSGGGVLSAPSSGGPIRVEVPSRPGVIVRSAAWSPDGREIAYVAGDSLLARDLASGADRQIATGADLHSCRWSPDARYMACVSGNSFHATVGSVSGVGPMFGNLAPSRIVLVRAQGGTPVSVTDSLSLHQSPFWSRDSRTLFYVSNRQGPADVYALPVAPEGGTRRNPARITTGMGAHSADLSADGTRIVYAVYNSNANVWALPIPKSGVATTASAVQLTFGNQTVEGVRVSPDRRWLVYDSDLSGNSDVYRLPLAGGESERLTRDGADEFRGVLSPNGKELAYHSYQTGARNVFLRQLDGGAVQQLTHSSAPRSMPNWSPDGGGLAMFDISTAQVFVMRRDARGRWGSIRFTGGSGWRPEWSPDGRSLAFISPVDGRIRVVPADSGLQRDVYVPMVGDPPAELAIFAESGEELYFKSHDARGHASIWSVPIRRGRPRLLVRFDDQARPSNRFEFATDGTRFYFAVEDRQSDIWVAETSEK